MTESAGPSTAGFWTGFAVGCGLNFAVAFLLAGLSLLVFVGAGLSSDPGVDASNRTVALLAWICCPACTNLPGVLYALAGRRRAFLKGWLLSLALAALLVLCAGSLFGAYLWLLARGEGAGG